MKTLAFSADILLPNITEAALLTGMEYRKEYDEAYIEELTAALHEKGVGTVVLTGVSYEPETTGVAVSGKGFRGYYRHARLARTCHGTGDLFASAFTGLLCRGYEPFPAAEAAAEFVLACAPSRSTGTACGLSRCSIRSRRRPRGSIFRNDLAARQSA